MCRCTLTATRAQEVVESLPAEMNQGIYYCWARVSGDVTRKAVMSVGWNPFYKNTKRSAEVHIMHEFADDFYGSMMDVLVVVAPPACRRLAPWG